MQTYLELWLEFRSSCLFQVLQEEEKKVSEVLWEEGA